MPIQTALWKVGPNPEPLREVVLPSERTLEDMIVAAPRLLSDEWMLIGQQVQTPYNGCGTSGAVPKILPGTSQEPECRSGSV